jgi:hypothetical protein
VQETLEKLAEELEKAEREIEDEQRKRIVIIAIVVTVTIVFSSLILPNFSAARTASSTKHGQYPAVDVRYRSFKGSAGQVTEPNLTLIGAIQKAVFFYDVDDKRTIVIPQAQIVSIEVPA